MNYSFTGMALLLLHSFQNLQKGVHVHTQLASMGKPASYEWLDNIGACDSCKIGNTNIRMLHVNVHNHQKALCRSNTRV